MILLSDKALPSVVGFIVGRRVKGSWWGHKKGHEIFGAAERLEAHPDALVTRLVSGKVTYLHRRLWPDFLSIANGREPWQTSRLSSGSRRLLASVTKEGEVRMDRYPARGRETPDSVHELERSLLVYTDEIHTERGTHTKVLMTWSRCPKIRDQSIPAIEPTAARGKLDKLVDELNRTYGGDGRLPWRQ
jgi:hypothetical protein